MVENMDQEGDAAGTNGRAGESAIARVLARVRVHVLVWTGRPKSAVTRVEGT